MKKLHKKASAIANANLALVKYWGKRNKKLKLPYNNSISVTLSDFYTHTTVGFSTNYSTDLLTLNGQKINPQDGSKYKHVAEFLNILRSLYPRQTSGLKVKIVSQNNFPTKAGLASSASGFAALAAACNQALNLHLNKKGLSILARLGSGSASRSIYGGFVEWIKGYKKSGSDSYAKQIVDEDYWPEFRIITCIVDYQEKTIKSRAGMEATVKTSPFYSSWLKTVTHDIRVIRNAIVKKDFQTVGRAAENNCLKLHALMLSTTPPLIYWREGTLQLIRAILKWRMNGLNCYFTIDAGPQVNILCQKNQVVEILPKLKRVSLVRGVRLSHPGGGIKITNSHLF